MFNQERKALKWMQKFLRFNDYIAASALYLQGNYLLKEPLKMEHIKPRILGHWGTVPGLNFIYANLNYLIWKHKCEILLLLVLGMVRLRYWQTYSVKELLRIFIRK